MLKNRKLITFIFSLFMLLGVSTTPIMAVTLGDNLGGGSGITDTSGGGSSKGNGIEGVFDSTKRPGNSQTGVGSPARNDESSSSIADFLSGYQPVTEGQMAEGKALAEPLVDLVGKFISAGIAIITVLLGAITVLDMAYILIPACRNFLYQAGTNGAGATMPGQQVHGGGVRGITQWVSNEAIRAVANNGGGIANNSYRPGGAGGMGMGGYGGAPRMGGYGGAPGMGGMGAAGGQAPQGGANPLVTYFKSRVVTIIIFAVCIVLLFSNLFFNIGTILAQWLFNIISYIGTLIPLN